MSDKVRIGIPQALLYYQYLPMWKTFFEELGAEIVVSESTTKAVLGWGCEKIVGDVCLPVKVLCGHVHSLKDKCDYVFMPSVHSVSLNAYNCPKFIGVPDVVRASIPGCPPILDPDVDINKGRRRLNKSVYKLAQSFSRHPRKARTALDKSLDTNREYIRQMQQQGLTPPRAIAAYLGREQEPDRDDFPAPDVTIAIIGHPYMVYDSYVNHELLNRLKRMGVKLVFSSMIAGDKIRTAMEEIVEKAYWGYEEDIVGAGGYFLQNEVDGIIGVTAFGCGPDSLMMELVQRRANKVNKPLLSLVLDEHNADVGMITRLEAFVDMIRRRDKTTSPQKFYINRHNSNGHDGVKILGVPNMANIAPAFRTSMEMLGATMINPPLTRKTIALGARYSPEFACLPFKGILGTFIEALDMGAESLFMATSVNACRMGYYSKVQEEILRDMGYEFRFLRSTSEDKGLLGILRAVKRFANNSPWTRIIGAYRLGTAKLKALDNLERKVEKYRAIEIDKGQTSVVYREAIKAIDEVTRLPSLKPVVRRYNKELDGIKKDLDYTPLKVGIIGEIYVAMDPFFNMDLEAKLGLLGVEVRRTKTTYFSEWTNLGAVINLLSSEKKKLQKYAHPYLKRDVGGHGLESVGEKVRLGREGYDGLVHIAPFTCMPEAIAQNVMLNTKEDIPVLTLICDEQMGEAGMTTRLEAFVDLIERRRRQKLITS